MPLAHYSKFSMFTLRIWVYKSGGLKNVFIFSKAWYEGDVSLMTAS